ncbi:nicotinate-nucleotide--dimethylbenzimidazole phosphoribosyltransferase [Peptostreptococcus faecalis]|uniref:nicotinate-nucleotide--dimethylbenzimidazole phosphoribosyltransferase n=1 Tax=Peptostreptococcus faecalis TaxID=2045015 RepID=UPI000C7B2E63|nr:nicotinate-nucleotide--dimethylbenzimidazole phosphoribosyltransferase [Peptostreptococcus faecalis]
MNLLVSISRNIYSLDEKSMKKARQEWEKFKFPLNMLGKIENITVMMAGVYGNSNLENSPKKCIITFAADHGVYAEGVSSQPQEMTRELMIEASNKRGILSPISTFNNTDTIFVDMGMKGENPIYGVLDYKIREGTDNISEGPAMSVDEAVKSIEMGIEVAERCIIDGYKVIGVGEIGISNTTSATAILSVMSGIDPNKITDSVTGLNDKEMKHKIEVIRKSIEVNNPNPTDGIEVLSKVGGFEIGGVVGVILGCAANRIPVVLDGYITYAAALIAYRINPLSVEYLIPSHLTNELGAKKSLEMLKLDPILMMNMTLGEGVGAALAMNVIDAATYAYNSAMDLE